jgi:hyperosmotically inducible protein
MQLYSFRLSACALALAGIIAVPTGAVFAQTPPDNTKVNTRDRAKGAVTADQQKENAGDRALTQKIRRAVVADKSLSTYAYNVKIVAQGGQVTLKGPVRSEDEKRSVEAMAVEVAGAGHVTNQMSIASSKAVKK